MQSAWVLQLVPQVLALAHRYGLHAELEPAAQVPKPSQAKPVCWPALQLVLPQALPGGYNAHEPFPAHDPVRPQEFEPSSGHSPSGSVATATLPQMPFAPPPFLAALQA